jgi:hypothetical protein
MASHDNVDKARCMLDKTTHTGAGPRAHAHAHAHTHTENVILTAFPVQK